jgi:glycosyltransferase involved in cell wall biosynthesis
MAERVSINPGGANRISNDISFRPESGRSRIVGVATSKERLGTRHHGLFPALGIEVLSTEQPLRQLLESIRSRRPLLCHLQYEYRTFGGPLRSFLALPSFAARVSRICSLVMTLHGVVPRTAPVGRWHRISFLVYRSMLRKTARHVSQIVVFSEGMRSELESNYGIRNVVVIPHGCDAAPPSDAKPDPPYLLLFGYLRPSKGILELLDAFAIVGAEFPDLGLVIAGSPAKRYESAYVDAVHDAVTHHPFRGRITLKNQFIEYAEKDRLAQGAELIVLPYKDRFVEVSGIVHGFASSGVPILCSDSPRFDELREGVEALHVPPTGEGIAAGIRRVLTDAPLRARLSEGLRQKGARESWDAVGQRYLELYETTIEASRSSHGPAKE